jgi:antitoxin (DNA-binding transcriptional repressor) of toxin-antitoxin stability system
MQDVDLRYAKEHLEELIARAAAGEEVRVVDPTVGTVRLTVVADHGTDQAPRYPKRIPGLLKGRVQISDEDLLAPLTNDELSWLSGETSP